MRPGAQLPALEHGADRRRLLGRQKWAGNVVKMSKEMTVTLLEEDGDVQLWNMQMKTPTMVRPPAPCGSAAAAGDG